MEVLKWMDRKLGGSESRAKTESQILEAITTLKSNGTNEATGYEISKQFEELHPPKHWWQLMGYGTLYSGLSRLENKGILDSRWESLQLSDSTTPKQRRIYHLVNRQS